MDPAFHSPSHGTRVFRGACAVLVLIALAQGAAVAVAWKEARRPAPGPVDIAPVPPVLVEPVAPPLPAAVDPFDPAVAALDDPHPEMAGPAGEDPLVPEPGVIARPPVLVAAPLDVPLTDESCLRHLDEGIYRRDRGDMVGAVASLRKALEMAPEHPKLLYQLASALDGMSQERKAAPLWRQLRLLGKGAGNYYQLAVERLREGGSLPAPDEAAAAGEEEKAGRFTVTGISVERLPVTADGEVLAISGQIDRHQAESADVSQVDIKLHLFDEVNGQRIDRTTALPPVLEWLDAPVDWAQGSERFRFEYRQAPLSPDELVKLGQRKYYGYAIEFRYAGNQLQDLAAEPSFLAEMARDLPESPVAPPGGERFDAAAPGAAPGQPDAVLFPGDRFSR